jgi:hypothetical protein
MAISDYQAERREIQHKGKVLFTVEGLSLSKLAILVRTHMPDFEAIFDLIADPKNEDPDFALHISKISVAIAVQAPGLAHNIIAACQIDEPLTIELVEQVSRLPLPLQVEALTQIAALSFEEAGSIKKTIESLMMMLAKMRMQAARRVEKPKMPLPAHIRDSAGM